MLMVFSNAFLTLVGASWMAAVNSASCSSVSSSTCSCSNSCSAWVSVMAARTSGLDAISAACSLVMSVARTWVMAATICSGAASVRVSRISSSCSVSSSAGSISGIVVVDESVSCSCSVCVVSSVCVVGVVGCSVSSGTVSSGTVSTGSSNSGTVSSGTVVDVSGSVVSGSWTLDENFDWQPPTPKPSDASETKRYAWFEPNRVWIELV